MNSPILIKDNTIAFSRLLFSVGEVAVEWPHDVCWTPYGYFIPTNAASANILDYLEHGPPSGEDYAQGSDSTQTYRGMIIDNLGRVFLLELSTVAEQLVLTKTRIMTGEGAVFVYADSVFEHEKAMMSMRLRPTLESALEIYLDNTAIFQHQYNVYDIDAISDELDEMGMCLVLP